ncbi:trichohyalin-like [Pocillopora damicornis]|uniref:trichohyalin-like n=1 Tax=Pocillopora damicornis TaxID=46731 RepID=UPI000F554023|nr:trichohyalin-like [Pocillopora damicornis]
MSGFKKFFKKKSPSAKNTLSTEDLSDAASIASGYSISKDKDLPKLHKAVWSGDLTKVKQLAKKGDVNQLDKENRTALHLACSQGKEDIVKFLLANNAKTNLCDNYGRTPLMKVVECQFVECVKILLEHGAQADVIDVNNSTPLHLSAANGDIDIAVLLLEREAKVDAKDKEGFTPLHVSASLGNLDFVNFLINEGAQIDQVDAHGRTALMTAASEGHMSIVRLFLRQNANTELKDAQGWKASDHAVIHGHHSISNIIEEHEEQQEKAKNQARAATSNKPATQNKKGDFSGLLGSGTATNDADFSFGGPVADEGGYNSTSAKEEDSASHHSGGGGNSWSSSDDDDDMLQSTAKSRSGKPSLLAALSKSSKPVTRTASDVSTQSAKSNSRIPVRTNVVKTEPIQESKPVARDNNVSSRIPVKTDENQSPSPAKKPLMTEASQKSSPTNSQQSTPTRRKLPTPGGVGQVVKESPQLSRATPQRVTEDQDSEGAISDTDVLAALSGGNTKLSKPDTSAKPPEKANGDLDFSLLSSDGEENDGEDVSFSEPPLDDEDDELLTRPSSGFTPSPQPLTSTRKPEEESVGIDKKENATPKLNFELGSPVSSVSDPDLSGISDNEPAKKGSGKKSDKPEEPVKPAGGSQSEEESAWDSSDDLLPSDGPDTTRGSSLFGTRSPPPTKTVGETKPQLKVAASPRKTDVNDSDSEVTESEGEWEKERALEKAKEKEKQEQEDLEREKEKQRMLQWEKERKEKEEALARELQAELEMEMEMERKEREEEERRRREEEEEENERRRKEKEENERRRRQEEERRREREEEEGKLRREEEEEARRCEREREEREKEEKLERELRRKEGERRQLELQQEEERRKREEEVQRIKEQNERDMRMFELQKEQELERQMRLKEEEMERQKREYEERLERERIALEEQRAKEAEDLLHKQRTADEEAEILLQAYRRKQEELLEKERLFEEEMIRRERELEEKKRKDELERIASQDMVTVVQKDSTYSAAPLGGSLEQSKELEELEEWKRMYEMNVEQEKTALEDAVRKRREEEQKAAEAAEKLRQIQQEEDLKRIEGALRHRRQGEEVKEAESKLKRLEVEEQAVQAKKEIEQQRLMDLEAQKNRLDQETSTKLAEFNNRHRRAELEKKSRQILEERDHLSTTFEATRQRTTELNQPPSVSLLSPDKRLSVVSLGSEADRDKNTSLSRNPAGGYRMKDKDKPDGEQMNSQKPLTNGFADDGDWSESSEEDHHGRYSPLVAMTMNGTNAKPPTGISPPRSQSPLYKASTPLNTTGGGLGTSSLSSSFALQDSTSFARLQEALRDSKRQVDKQKERIVALETSRKQMEIDLAELQLKVETLTKERSESERLKMEVESAYRTLQYKHEQESEALRVSEALQSQLKEQISRSEEKLAKELEKRQNLEVEKRQQQTEVKSLRNTVQQLESDIRDLKRALAEEQDTRAAHGELLDEERRKNDALMEETRHHSQQKTEALYQLEAVDKTRKSYEESSGSLREELKAALVELAETKARLEATKASMGKEISILKEKLEKKAVKVAKHEEALLQTRAEFDSHVASGRNEHAQISSKLESETQTRTRLESEVSSLRSRLEKSDKELERASVGRVEAERQVQNLRDELYQAKLRLEKETFSLKDTNKGLAVKLEAMESKASNLDIELQNASLLLTERGSQLNLVQRDTEYQKSQFDRLQEKIRLEKEQNSRLTGKLESSDHKISSLHAECDTLRRRLEEATEKLRKQEEVAMRSEEKFNGLLASSRADFEKSKQVMQEKHENLLDMINKLKSDVEKGKEKSAQQKAHIRDLQQELNETSKKLVQTETTLAMQTKLREELEDERSQLRNQLSNLENFDMLVSFHYLFLSQSVEEDGEQPAQLEKMVTKLKVEKAQVESSLREEEAKCGMLLREVKDANEARQSLEKLLSNVKGDSVELENKLQSETLSRTQHEREAEEHKELWESEVRSRTKLGAKIAEMEKRLDDARVEIEEEKRRTRKALEAKKVLEAKLEANDQRTSQHQREVVALKTQLKSYKRRFKVSVKSSNSSNFKKKGFNGCAPPYSILFIVSTELSAAKAQEKRLLFDQERLQLTNRQLEEEVGRLKAFYESNFVENGQLETYKQELEAKSRFELNRKLEEVNAHLEEQAAAREKLDKLREANELKTRKELEMTITDLKADVAKMRAGFHESQTRKETLDAEAKRYKDLYESEMKSKDRLASRLYKANEKMAESQALLNLERSRRNFDGLKRDTSPHQFTSGGILNGSPRTSPDRMYSKGDGQLMKAVEDELNKSIKRHLESAPLTSDLDLKPSLLSDGDSGSYGPLTASSKQYMSVLRKNYFV